MYSFPRFDYVMLNPQPLPPRFSYVLLNPQPLPPRYVFLPRY